MRFPRLSPLRRFTLLLHWLLVPLFCAPAVRAATYYVATDGNDSATGSISAPFATLQRGQQAASPGDTVFIRGGTYVMTEDKIATFTGIWAYVTHLNKSGAPHARINYWAYPGERPVFDYSAVKPADRRVIAYFVSGSWLHLRGLEVVGVQVTILGHTQSECFENQGSNNIYEQLSMHDGMAIGIYLNRGSNNLILNCDAYRNWDSVSQNGVGGNVDGFGGHPRAGGTNNVFRGCRAWFNSDDGYDSINAYERVVFEHCQAFFNGYTPDFVSRGDGNGFKSGGYGAAGGASPSIVPRHATNFCLAVRNKANGLYSNHHIGGSDWIGNTAFQNSTNYNLLSVLADNDTDVPGYGHYLRNNLGFSPRNTSLSNLDQAASDAAFNFFNLPVSVAAADFVATTTDLAQLEAYVAAPRQPNGNLPLIPLLRLAAGSDLIDAGDAAGYPFLGAAPDLGNAEYGAETTARTLVWRGAASGNRWDLNVTDNWMLGTIPARFGPNDRVSFDDSRASELAVLGYGGELWPGAVSVVGNRDLTLAASVVLAGPMSFTLEGSGVTTLAGAHRYTGSTIVRSGTLRLTGSLTNSSTVEVLSGATLDLVGALSVGSVTVRPGGRLIGGGTLEGTLINEGLVEGDGAASALRINGPANNLAGGVIRLTRGASLTVVGPLHNAGVLDLITVGATSFADLAGPGSILNAASVSPPAITADGEGFSLAQPTFPGHAYQLQRSTSLQAGEWTDVGASSPGSGGLLVVSDFPSQLGSRVFYRFVVWP